MATNNNATCSICGKSYHKCISCKDLMASRPWQMHTCSSNHYQVFMIVKGFSTGVYTKDEAREKFKKIDLSDLESYRDNIKSVIKDILKEDKKVKKHNTEFKAEKVENKVEKVNADFIREDDSKAELEVE